MWHVTCDKWNVTCSRGWIFQLPIFMILDIHFLLMIKRMRRINHWLNHWSVCRAAPATPSLINITQHTPFNLQEGLTFKVSQGKCFPPLTAKLSVLGSIKNVAPCLRLALGWPLLELIFFPNLEKFSPLSKFGFHLSKNIKNFSFFSELGYLKKESLQIRRNIWKTVVIKTNGGIRDKQSYQDKPERSETT